MHRNLNVAAIVFGLVLAPAACSRAADTAEKPLKQIRTADCVYVPTPNDVVEKMLEMAGVKKSDLLYDLGSGDGRIVVTAARKFGCKAIGYEIDPERVADARKNIEKRKVGETSQDRAGRRLQARPDPGERGHDLPAPRHGGEAPPAAQEAQGRLADRRPRLSHPRHQGRQGGQHDRPRRTTSTTTCTSTRCR